MYIINLQFNYLPPTKEALIQQIHRAVYQGGIIWGQALEGNAKVLPPSMWGWKEKGDKTWSIYWTALNPI